MWVLAVGVLFVGAAVLAAALGGAGEAQQDPVFAAEVQANARIDRAECYTLDTSRPEWLSRPVYLPAVLKERGS
jgi:hypothetical protein